MYSSKEYQNYCECVTSIYHILLDFQTARSYPDESRGRTVCWLELLLAPSQYTCLLWCELQCALLQMLLLLLVLAKTDLLLRAETLRRAHHEIDLPQQPQEHPLDPALVLDLLPQPVEQLVHRRRLAPQRRVDVAEHVRHPYQVRRAQRVVQEPYCEGQDGVDGLLVAVGKGYRKAVLLAQLLYHRNHLQGSRACELTHLATKKMHRAR